MGQARALGPEAWVKQKALEPLAWVKQRPWSHEPGSSKGSGAICLGQAKVEGTQSMGHAKVEGLGHSSGLQSPTCDQQSPHSSALVVLLDSPQKPVCRNSMARVLSELPAEFLGTSATFYMGPPTAFKRILASQQSGHLPCKRIGLQQTSHR